MPNAPYGQPDATWRPPALQSHILDTAFQRGERRVADNGRERLDPAPGRLLGSLGNQLAIVQNRVIPVPITE